MSEDEGSGQPPVRRATVLVDPAAAAARASARRRRVAEGLDELSTWIGDQLRGGLAELGRSGRAAVEEMAARMVDAQAPGVASLLRALPAEPVGEDWPQRVLDHLAALHLLVRAHQRLAELPPELAATVRSRVGYPLTRRDVLAGPAVEDAWLAVGQVDVEEYRLQARRVWLWGHRSRRWALWLTFAPTGTAPDRTVTAGQWLHGRLHFYPGSGQYRAVPGEGVEVRGAGEGPGPPPESLPQARARYGELLAADPWAVRMPAVLLAAPVPPVEPHASVAEPVWRLRDPQGWCRDLVGSGGEPWPLLARSGGDEIAVAVEWSGTGVRALAVLDERAVWPLPQAA